VHDLTVLIRLAWSQRSYFIVACVATALGVGATIVAPTLLGQAVNDIQAGDETRLLIFAGLILGVGFLSFGLSIVRKISSQKMGLNAETQLRLRAMDRLGDMDSAFVARFPPGQMIARIISDTRPTRTFISNGFISTLDHLFTFLAAGIALIWIDWLYAVIALVPLPFMTLLSKRYGSVVGKANLAVDDAEAQLNDATNDSINGMELLHAYGRRSDYGTRFNRWAGKVRKAQIAVARTDAIFIPPITVLPMLALLLAMGVGGILTINGRISLGEFVAGFAYISLFLGRSQSLTNGLITYKLAAAGLRRIEEVIHFTSSLQTAGQNRPEGQRVSLTNLSVTSEADSTILVGIDLDIHPDKIVAIVGRSGAGKSVLLSLFNRYMSSTAGEIAIERDPLVDFQIEALRDVVAMATDDDGLLSMTVADNIAYGAPAASRDEVIAAAKAATAHDFILTLADGYDTQIGAGGIGLSGGQAERIALARALLADRPILLLDNVTGSLDAETERRTVAEIQRRAAGRTVLLASHRPALVALADEIIVLDAGRIVGRGKNDELMASCPEYRELARDWQKTLSEAETVTSGDATVAAATDVAPPSVDSVKSPARETEATSADTAPTPSDPQPGNVWRFILFAKPYWRKALVVLGLGLVAVIAGTLPNYLYAGAIDNGIDPKDEAALFGYVAAFGFMSVLYIIAGASQAYLLGRTAADILRSLRERVFGKVLRLPFGYFDRTENGVIISRIANDIPACHTLLSSSLILVFETLVTLLVVLVLMFVLDWQLALLMLAIVPLFILVIAVFKRRAIEANAVLRNRITDLTIYVENTMSLVKVINTYGQSERHKELFRKYNEATQTAAFRAMLPTAILISSLTLIGTFGTAMAIAVGGTQVVAGTGLSVGVVVAFVGYLSSFFGSINSMSSVTASFMQGTAAIDKIFEVLDEPEEQNGTRQVNADDYADGLMVQFDNVSFGYLPGTTVIEDLNLTLDSSRSTALVGSSGSGKSTLLKLALLLYDPVAGRITIDGVPAAEFDRDSLRRHFGYVPQQTHLFATSLRENLALGRPEATDAELLSALEVVNCRTFVEELPQQLDTKVSPGSNEFSSGTKQLFAIARALVANPALLVMDEATASVDPATERDLVAGIDRLQHDRTSLTVAHRLATIANADEVIVFDSGRIAERGTRQELANRGGSYARLEAAYRGDETNTD
jgi:ATP-binding cassette subfamily B protein